MSKLVFLCTFLVFNIFFTAAGSEDESEITLAFDKISSSVNEASSFIKRIFQESYNKANEVAEKLQNKMLETVQRVVNELKEPINQFESKWQKLKETNKNFDTQECESLANTYRNEIVSIIKNSSMCTTDLMDEVGSYIDNMYYVSEKTQNNINDIKRQSRQCTEGIEGVLSGSKSLLCLMKLTAKSTKLIAEDVASAIATIGKMSTEIGITAAKISTCYVDELILTAPRNVLKAIDDVAKCTAKFAAS